ncbi:MAG: glycosyl hydrolase, partial [Chitinophagaceae bacterium]
MGTAQLSGSKGEESYAAKEADFFKGLKYRNIGPFRGGRSTAAAGSAKRKNEYYFGATGGGLWKTTDGGFSWNPVTDSMMGSSSVGAIGISESNPDIIYIDTGESEFRGNIMQGDGVYKSTDAGKTWKNVGLKATQTISRIRVHPTNPDIAYAAALGHAYNKNEDRGVYRTKDGGKTWQKVLYKSNKAGAEDLIIDPSNPNIIYAAIWEVYRTPWMMWGGGDDCGLYKSIDGGDTWEDLTKKPGMPKGPLGKIGVTVSPVKPERVWAVIEADSGGVYRSDDAGKSWKYINRDRKLRQRAFYYSRIYADPVDSNGIYGLNVGFFKSNDGGKTFNKTIRVPHGDNHDLWIDPADPMRMVTANDGGGCVTVNGGKTWTDEDFPTAQLYHIMVTSDFPYHVAGAQQDNSTVAVPSEGWTHMNARTNTIKRGTWSYAVGGGESGYIAQDPKNADIFYAGSYSAVLTRINRKTGESKEVTPYPRYFMGEAPKDIPERWQWTFPIVFSQKDPTRLYTSSQHVWVTTDEGNSWTKISPDLTLADTSTMGISGGIVTNDMTGVEVYGTVFALAPSFHDVNTIWAGSDDGLMHITRDGGKNWTKITPPDMQKHTRVSIIDESKHKPGVAYVAAKRYQMGDRAPYIWKTADYGKTWTKIVNGLPADEFVHSIREDIKKPGLLFAGTEHGVFVSFDDGAKWQPLQLNLPNTQVSDLAVTEKDLVVGTHGRSIYILDDIAPLREFKPEILDKNVVFFKPEYAVRRLQTANFQYYLSRPADSVKIEILDSNNVVINTFRSVKAKKDSAKLDSVKAAATPVGALT